MEGRYILGLDENLLTLLTRVLTYICLQTILQRAGFYEISSFFFFSKNNVKRFQLPLIKLDCFWGL